MITSTRIFRVEILRIGFEFGSMVGFPIARVRVLRVDGTRIALFGLLRRVRVFRVVRVRVFQGRLARQPCWLREV